jgi:hypothetical protein
LAQTFFCINAGGAIQRRHCAADGTSQVNLPVALPCRISRASHGPLAYRGEQPYLPNVPADFLRRCNQIAVDGRPSTPMRRN